MTNIFFLNAYFLQETMLGTAGCGYTVKCKIHFCLHRPCLIAIVQGNDRSEEIENGLEKVIK